MGPGWPREDVLGAPRLLAASLAAHRRSGAGAREFCLRASWKPGPAAARGEVLVSFTAFTYHHLGDLPAIWLASDRLGRQLVALPEAIGVCTYLQPGRRRVGSLSAWAGEAGLGRFVSLPEHLEVVRRYRPRGEPLASVRWSSEGFERGAALEEGLRRLG